MDDNPLYRDSVLSPQDIAYAKAAIGDVLMDRFRDDPDREYAKRIFSLFLANRNLIIKERGLEGLFSLAQTTQEQIEVMMDGITQGKQHQSITQMICDFIREKGYSDPEPFIAYLKKRFDYLSMQTTVPAQDTPFHKLLREERDESTYEHHVLELASFLDIIQSNKPDLMKGIRAKMPESRIPQIDAVLKVA